MGLAVEKPCLTLSEKFFSSFAQIRKWKNLQPKLDADEILQPRSSQNSEYGGLMIKETIDEKFTSCKTL